MPKRDDKGRFIEGHHYSPETEFKKGEHWREEKPYWNKEWLKREYVKKKRSASEIADDFDCTAKNIRYFLRKHNIPTRSISEAREVKHWGEEGKDNPMYGKTGKENPNWKGGITPERQAVYSSREWSKAVSKVWKRDDATCQRCGKKKESKEQEFHIHHIIPFKVEDKRTDPENLVLLCKECHQWVHSKENTNRKFLKEVRK